MACFSAVSSFAVSVSTVSLLSVGAVVSFSIIATAADLSNVTITLNNGSSSENKTVDQLADQGTYGKISSGSALNFNNVTIETVCDPGNSDNWAGFVMSAVSNNNTYSFTNTSLNGNGNVAFGFRSGGANPSPVLDFSSASNFTGRILFLNDYDRGVSLNYSGSSLQNAEIVLAKEGTSYKIGGDTVTSGKINTGTGKHALNLTGEASLSGVSAESSSRSAIQASASDTTLTLTGGCTTNQTYIFAGTVGASNRTINLKMMGGNQTFSGTNYLGTVNVSGGSLTLGGTTGIGGAVAVSSGGTLTLSGALTLPAGFTGIDNGGTVDMSGLTSLDVTALMTGSAEEGGTITLVKGNGTVTAPADWNSIIRSDAVGVKWTYANGILTYALSVNVLTYSSETALTWTNGATGFDAGKSFSNGDIVTFAGKTAVTLGEAISSAKVTIAEGADITLTGGGNKLTAGNMVLNGTLTLKDDALASGTKFDANGTGTLKIDVGTETGGEFTAANSVNSFAGTLQIESGRFQIGEALNASAINVVGGQLWVYENSKNYNLALSSDISLSGTGWNGDSDAKIGGAALRLDGAALSGTVTAEDGVSICCVMNSDTSWNYRGSITGTLAGSGTLYKTGIGTLHIYGSGQNGEGNITHTGDLVIQGGTVVIGNTYTHNNTVSFNSVTVESGTKFEFHHASTTASDSLYNTKIILNGGFLGNSLGSAATLTFGNVSVNAEGTTIRCNHANSKIVINSLALNHSVSLTGSGAVSATNTVANIAAETTATLSGSLTAENFSKTGEGSFALAEGASLTITGELAMNYEGALDFSAGTLTLNDGVTLKYTKADGIVATANAESGISLLVDEGTSANLIGLSASNFATGISTINISVASLLSGALPQTINLGISTDVAKDLLKVKESYYTLVAEGGYYVLKYKEDTSGWDENWGKTVIDEAPTTVQPVYVAVADLPVIDEGGERYVYATGTQITSENTGINLAGTDAPSDKPLIVVGGTYTEANGTGNDYTGDSWIKATAGDYLAIAGGNLANNWNGSGVSNFIGDSHILVDGATVGTLIGGNYKDAQGASMTGNSYISVKSGNVTGSIIGASLSIFIPNGGSQFTGNTNIFIYTPLNENTSSLWNEANNVICGGFAAGYYSNSIQKLTGDTHVTVDLTTYDGAAESITFGKHIIGGNVGYSGSKQTLDGDTNVSVNLKGGKMNNACVVGGSWVGSNASNNDESTITGSTNVTVENGSYLNVVGGSYCANGDNIQTTVKDTNVTLENNAIVTCLTGSSYVSPTASGTLNAGKSTVTISSGDVTLLMGGFYVGTDTNSKGITATIGDIEVSLDGGTLGYAGYGGSVVYRESDTTVKQGNITVNLNSGTLNGSLYAAGGQMGANTITTDSTTVNISSSVTMGNGTLISGGYDTYDDPLISTITGDRTLVFADAQEYANLSGVSFYDFDKVDVTSEDGVATLNGGIGMKNGATDDAASFLSFEKTGAGKLIIESATQNRITVSKGTLSTGGGNNTVTSVEVASGATLSLGSGGTNTLTSVTVNRDGTLDATEGGTSLGGSLTLGSGSTLSLGTGSLDLGNNTLTILGDLTLSTTTPTSADGKVSLVLANNVSECLLGEGDEQLTLTERGTVAWQYISLFTADETTVDMTHLRLVYSNGEVRLITDPTLLGDYYSDALDADGNASVGAGIADDVLHSEIPPSGTPLAEVLDRLDDLIDRGDLSGGRKLAASLAGSTVTALGHAQKNALRDLMGTIRDRMGTLGVNDLVVNEDLPNFHLWAQGNANYAKLDSKRDQAGYTLNTYGGTVGADADFTENVSAGIAFTAAWGDLDAQAAETATGDLDGYYLSLYAQAKGARQTHKLILTGASFDATLNRTVNYGTGSYRANGSTNGYGFGAMYEGSYDFYLNEDRDAFFRPWVNLSVVHSQTDTYTETGEADNAALRVGKQEMTTATFAAGVSFVGAMSENLLGRPVWGEFRAGVSQDAGDDRCTADVGLAGMPAYTGTLRGAKEGRTALQLGAGLNVPMGEQSNVYFNVNAAFRSHASSVSGSVGYRYDF